MNNSISKKEKAVIKAAIRFMNSEVVNEDDYDSTFYDLQAAVNELVLSLKKSVKPSGFYVDKGYEWFYE